MKKLLTLLLSACTLLCVGIGLTACGEVNDGIGTPEHTHFYETEWSFDENEHWHNCETEGCNQVRDKTEHVFTSACDDTCVCGYKRNASHDFSGEWFKNESEHWRECKREDCNEIEQSAHSFSEWETFDAEQHMKVCECGEVLFELHSWDSGEVTTESSCEQIGVRTYRCTACNAAKTEEFGDIGHEYEKTIRWIGEEAVIDLVCKKDSSHQHTGNMRVTKTEVGATCNEDAKDILVALYEFDGQTFTDTKTITHTNTASGHKYVLDGWDWTGYSSANAKFVCENNEEHEQIIAATISRDTVDATCQEDGEITYSAVVAFEGKDYTDVQKEPIVHTGHKYAFDGFEWSDDCLSAKAKLVCEKNNNHTRKENLEVYETTYKPTCDEDGYVVYSVFFRYEDVVHQDSKQVIDEGSATGHDFEEFAWFWKSDYSSVQVKLYCNTCSTYYRYDGTITSETFPANCKQAGRTEYTAIATVQDKTYTKIETVVIPAAHDMQGGVCSLCGYRESVGLEYQETDGGWEVLGRGTCTDTEIYIPESYQGKAVVKIAIEALKNQTDVTLINVPSSVICIEKGAFKGCTALEELTIPFVGRENTDSYYFYIGYIFGASDYDINIEYTPASLRKLVITGGFVRSNALYSCNNVKEIHILEGAKVQYGMSQGSYTRYGGLRNCTSVERLTLPKGASELSGQSFSLGCYFVGTYSNWTKVPSSLKFLSVRGGLYCNISGFDSCNSNVKDLVIGNSLTETWINAEKVVNLFYEGTEEAYNALSRKPSEATNIYFYSEEKPTVDGKFWHWGDDGVTPMAWEVHGTWKFASMTIKEGDETTEVKVGDEGVTEDYVVVELKTDGTFVRTDTLSNAEKTIYEGEWKQVGDSIIVTLEGVGKTWSIDADGVLSFIWQEGTYPNRKVYTLNLKKV